MEIWLMRHAAAEERASSGRDADRTLTEDGHRRAREVARGLAEIEPGIQLILTSPYARPADRRAGGAGAAPGGPRPRDAGPRTRERPRGDPRRGSVGKGRGGPPGGPRAAPG